MSRPRSATTACLYLAIGALIASSTPAVAAAHLWSVRVFAGGNASWLSPAHGSDATYRADRNPSLGVLVAGQRSSGTGFETGVMLDRRGVSWSSHFPHYAKVQADERFARDLDLLYGILPLRVRETKRLGRVALSFHGGAEWSYLLWARQTTTDRRNHSTHSEGKLDGDGLVAWELSASVGGRIATPWAGREAFLELSYAHGVWRAAGPIAIEGTVETLASRVLRLSVGASL